MPRHLLVLLLLATTQIVAWGVISPLPVIAGSVAAEFGAALPSVFVGTSLMFVAMGLGAPVAGRAFLRFGTQRVMTAGAGMMGLGLGLLGLSTNLATFLGAWTLNGLAGAMVLSTAAYAYLAEQTGERARRQIGTLMLVTGLAGSVFWPLTAALDRSYGWRETLLLYAGMMIFIICPLIGFGLPQSARMAAGQTRSGSGRKGPVFGLLVAAIATNSFVTFGIEAVGIVLLQAMGMSLPRAIGIASLLGLCKVGGRVVDLLGGRMWTGLTTGIVSGVMIPAGLLAMWMGGAGPVSVAGYLLLFGVGSGAFAVSRATMPLVFWTKSDYTAAMANLALPMNLINALAPPLIAAMMGSMGAQATFAVLGGLSLVALVFLLILNGMRSQPALAR